MLAMVLERPGQRLELVRLPVPQPKAGQVIVAVEACAVCRTDLHVVDGDLPMRKSKLVLGHQVVGRICAVGPEVSTARIGERVGVPWLGWTCGACRYCLRGKENLCERAIYTGYHTDGGYAEQMAAYLDFVIPLPGSMPAAELAPLLCAGLIGYRSYRFTQGGSVLGLYGFGAAAHLLAQVARYEGRRVFAFARRGDEAGVSFARQVGADWAGYSGEAPPEPLDAAIIFAPVGALIPEALRAVDRGGVVVAAGIHMSDIPSFPYRILWEERSVCSVANLTREDARLYFALAPRVPVHARVTEYGLDQAWSALKDLREGRVSGAAVLVVR
jgi:propanol-preferring alcohol dehydrogenase